jgi:glutamine synthetase
MDIAKLKAEIESRGIKRAKIGGFDVDGVLRGKYVALDKLYSVLDKGFGFCDVIFGWDVADVLYDNAAVTGWHTGYPDTGARLDAATFRVLPSEPTAAHMLCDFWSGPSTPHPACPRNLLKTVTARAEALGYAPQCSVEFEFWIFRESPQSLREKGFVDLTPLSPGMFGYSWVRQGQHVDLIEDVLDQMAGYGIDIEAFHTETGPGVYEAAIHHSDPVRAADMAALFKTTLKILCARHGLSVTFMAKWNPSMPGSSGHIHQSLFDPESGENLFAPQSGEQKSPIGLSALGQHYLAGVLSLSPDLTAIYAPTVNSYRRYVPGMWAPLTPSWGVENRTCSLRVISGPTPKAARVELRQTAADINPYLAIAAALASGLYGIEQRLPLPPPSSGDASASSGSSSGARLPTSLESATTLLSNSDRARQVLPAAFIDHYVRTRDFEVRQHAKSVSQWELERYFEAI